MSRLNIGITILTSLAVHVLLPQSALSLEAIAPCETPATRQYEWDTPFQPGVWDSPDQRAPATDRVKLTAFEAAPVVAEQNEAELNTPVDTFDLQSQAMPYANGSRERVIDRVVDPTAWLMNFRFRESWNWPTGNSNADSEEFEFRPTVPFRAWDHVNILRVTVPYTVEGPGGPGLDDVTILDLVVHEADWGRWGVGPVVQLSPDGSDSLRLGPAVGAVSKSKYWTVGFLNQNFFADEVGETRFQPILAYKFDDQWAVGVGEFEFRYNWEDGEWAQVPLGVEVDYISDIYGQKFQFFVNPQYNFESDASNSGWTLFLGIALLVPDA